MSDTAQSLMGTSERTVECKICSSSGPHRTYLVREMMFGTRDAFTYIECSGCGCLQLLDPPSDLAKYYPASYYSLATTPEAIFRGRAMNVLRGLRHTYAATNRGLLGRLCYALSPDAIMRTLAPTGATKSSRILDVGCGSGLLLYGLWNAGFRSVLGVDPFIASDMAYPNGLQLRKSSIHELDGEWDTIMFHHAFEHVPDPFETLQSVARLLAPDGTCLLRVPTAPCAAWEEYREDWAQLDAPRHLFLHSRRSLQTLAGRAGLTLTNVIYDSTAFQFWGSEQYRRDIPLESERSYRRNPSGSIFTRQQIEEYDRRAAALNREERGDQAAFYLRKQSRSEVSLTGL